MYKRIRQIHLFAAFLLTTFILMYFITGFVMIFGFERKDTSVHTVVQYIPGVSSLKGDTLIAELRKNFDLSGQYQIRKTNDHIAVAFRHPGIEASAVLTQASDSVRVTKKTKNTINVMHQFHRLHGYYGGWNYLLWAFFYDLSSVAMIVFAITGVYLWYKTERTRWPGWLLLIALTLFTGFTLYYLHVIH